MTEKQGGLDGTLIRGADGTLYFIPEADLTQYQVPEEAAEKVEEALERGSARGVTLTDADLTPLAHATSRDDEMFACEGIGVFRPQPPPRE